MNLSSDMQSAFSDYLRDKELKLETDLSVQVLTTGFWPTYKSDDFALPNEMINCMDTFKQFYDGRTSHRRLRWVHSLGSATVLGSFSPNGKAKKHDLMVSTYQVRAPRPPARKHTTHPPPALPSHPFRRPHSLTHGSDTPACLLACCPLVPSPHRRASS